MTRRALYHPWRAPAIACNTDDMRNRGLVTLALLAMLAGAAPVHAALDDFARCLTQAGARFYGTSWCPHCLAQRRMFGPAVRYVPYVECSVNGTSETTA